MKVVNSSELQSNMKKYLFLWGTACLIVSCSPAPTISSYNEGINITPKTVFAASTGEKVEVCWKIQI